MNSSLFATVNLVHTDLTGLLVALPGPVEA